METPPKTNKMKNYSLRLKLGTSINERKQSMEYLIIQIKFEMQ